MTPYQYLILQYCLLIVFALCIVSLIVAKIHSPFWFHQPIQHTYELYPKYFARVPYVKRKKPPTRGIFCIPDRVYTWDIHHTTIQEYQSYIMSLIQGHYVDNETHIYSVSYEVWTKTILKDPFCMISLYVGTRRMEPTYVLMPDIRMVYGMMTSRPVGLYFRKYPEHNCEIHYWDHICIKQGLKHPENYTRSLIQTHMYNHHHKYLSSYRNEGLVYLFKKEIDLCKGVVPLTQTNVYTFVLKKTPIHKLPIYYRLRILNKTHQEVWRAIYVEMTRQFEICALPSMVATIDWLSNERYYVFATIYKEPHQTEHIHGVYIFEHTHISWIQEGFEKRPYMLRLVGSMCFGGSPMIDPQRIYFFRGFLHSLKQVLYDHKHFGILEIPNISHNHWILDKWCEKYSLKNETNMAYYLYNMIYPRSPIKASNVMVLV